LLFKVIFAFAEITPQAYCEIFLEIEKFLTNFDSLLYLKVSNSVIISSDPFKKLLSNLLESYSEHKIIIAGNNIQFDYEVVRRHLPKTSSKLNYSILDVSSIRKAFLTVGSDFGEKTKKEKLSNHNALIDIDECVKELKKYQNILRKGLEKNS